jgi:CspA family cold shock protein
MALGTVKWFDSKKGYGFIVGPEGKDVFVHFSVIEGDGFRSLQDGEQVEYEFRQGDKGLLANLVKRAADAAAAAGESGPSRHRAVAARN